MTLRSVLLSAGTIALLGVSGLFVWLDSVALKDVQTVGLPASERLPDLQRRAAMLTEQVDTMQVQASLEGGSAEELLQMYILPAKPDFQRMLGFLDLLRDTLKKKGLLKAMSAIHVGEKQGDVYPITVQFDVAEEGAHQILLATDLAGMLTVSDVLSSDEITMLLHALDGENPTVVTGLEQFFSLPLLQYAKNPTASEDKLLKTISSPGTAKLLQSILHASRLLQVQQVFGGDLGMAMAAQSLWPLQFVKIHTASMRALSGGNVHLDLVLDAMVRRE